MGRSASLKKMLPEGGGHFGYVIEKSRTVIHILHCLTTCSSAASSLNEVMIHYVTWFNTPWDSLVYNGMVNYPMEQFNIPQFSISCQGLIYNGMV